MKKRPVVLALLSLASLGLTNLSRVQAAGSLRVYSSAPFASTDTYSGAQIETFNSFATGTFTSLASSATTGNGGTYTASGATNGPVVTANNVYAASVGAGNYLAVTSGNKVTLTLAAAVPYVGIDVSAIDGGNSLSFYDATGSLIGTFDAATIDALFPNTAGTTVTAVNGTTKYNTTSYYGQPNAAGTAATTSNNGQVYAELHFFGQDGTTIKSIVFSQATGNGNFETENHSILTTAPAVDGTFVSVGTVPEPGVGVTIAAGCVGLLALVRLGRRTQ